MGAVSANFPRGGDDEEGKIFQGDGGVSSNFPRGGMTNTVKFSRGRWGFSDSKNFPRGPMARSGQQLLTGS